MDFLNLPESLKTAAMILGILVVAGQTIVLLTATKKDDEALNKLKAIPLVGKLISFLVSFSPIKPSN